MTISRWSALRSGRGRSAETVSLDEPPFDRLKFIDLPYPTNDGGP